MRRWEKADFESADNKVMSAISTASEYVTILVRGDAVPLYVHCSYDRYRLPRPVKKAVKALVAWLRVDRSWPAPG